MEMSEGNLRTSKVCKTERSTCNIPKKLEKHKQEQHVSKHVPHESSKRSQVHSGSPRNREKSKKGEEKQKSKHVSSHVPNGHSKQMQNFQQKTIRQNTKYASNHFPTGSSKETVSVCYPLSQMEQTQTLKVFVLSIPHQESPQSNPVPLHNFPSTCAKLRAPMLPAQTEQTNIFQDFCHFSSTPGRPSIKSCPLTKCPLNLCQTSSTYAAHTNGANRKLIIMLFHSGSRVCHQILAFSRF